MIERVARRVWALFLASSFLLVLCISSATAQGRFAKTYFAMYSANQVGNRLRSSVDEYFTTRNDFLGSIEEARREVQACGGCASATRKLEALEAEEEQFQRTAARLAGMSRMPPNIAEWLGIDTGQIEFMAPIRSSYDRGEGLFDVNPGWLASAPEFCAEASRSHLTKLRSYQDARRESGVEEVYWVGGPLFDPHRRYLACERGDYSEVRRLDGIEELRASGIAAPEIDMDGRPGLVYFGLVPDAFVPFMPEKDIVLEKLQADATDRLDIYMLKKGPEQLGRVTIREFNARADIPDRAEAACRELEDVAEEKREYTRRYCEDIEESYETTEYVLECRYTTSDPLSHDSALFWFGAAPAIARPEYIYQRWRNHPFQVVGDPRTECPETSPKAQQVMARVRSERETLKQSIGEIPPTETIPTSAVVREKRDRHARRQEIQQALRVRTKAFPLPGLYSARFDITAPVRDTRGVPDREAAPVQRSLSGQCAIARRSSVSGEGPRAEIHSLLCQTDEGAFSGQATEMIGGSSSSAAKQLKISFGSNYDGVHGDYLLADSGEAVLEYQLERDGIGVSSTLNRIRKELYSFYEYPLLNRYFGLTLFGKDALVQGVCRIQKTHDDPTAALSLHCADRDGGLIRSLGQLPRYHLPPRQAGLPAMSCR
ncbi:MAG: hypothetical protein AAGL49_08190, partial [Pseudomonadota bacterium]